MSEPGATVRRMEIVGDLTQLTPRELEALRGAAVWYANYHAKVVTRHAGNDASYAVSAREEYLCLIAALRKLGVKIQAPDELLADERQAA